MLVGLRVVAAPVAFSVESRLDRFKLAVQSKRLPRPGWPDVDEVRRGVCDREFVWFPSESHRPKPNRLNNFCCHVIGGENGFRLEAAVVSRLPRRC